MPTKEPFIPDALNDLAGFIENNPKTTQNIVRITGASILGLTIVYAILDATQSQSPEMISWRATEQAPAQLRNSDVWPPQNIVSYNATNRFGLTFIRPENVDTFRSSLTPDEIDIIDRHTPVFIFVEENDWLQALDITNQAGYVNMENPDAYLGKPWCAYPVMVPNLPKDYPHLPAYEQARLLTQTELEVSAQIYEYYFVALDNPNIENCENFPAPTTETTNTIRTGIENGTLPNLMAFSFIGY